MATHGYQAQDVVLLIAFFFISLMKSVSECNR